jgi:hypothetical protein
LRGNGATTPNKFMRALNGWFEIINSAYTNTPLRLDDTGNLQILGNLLAPGGLNAVGGTIQTSGALGGGSLYVGGSATITQGLSVGAGITAGGEIYTPDIVGGVGNVGAVSFPGGGAVNTNGAIYSNSSVQGLTVNSTGGNVTAYNGRLAATYGATGTGPNGSSYGTILGDFPSSFAINGWFQFPSMGGNLIIQWGETTMSGPSTCEWAFPRAFPGGAVVYIGSTPANGTLFNCPVSLVTWTSSYAILDTNNVNDQGNLFCVAIGW